MTQSAQPPDGTRTRPVAAPVAAPAAAPAHANARLMRLVDRLLVRAAREIQMLAALTPRDAQRERARLVDALRQGRPATPRWDYARTPHDELRRALSAAERALEEHAETPLDHLYLERIRELAVEASLCAAAGTRDVAMLARERFGTATAETAAEASALAGAWLAEGAGGRPPRAESLESDAPGPRSLVARLRAEVGRLRLPFTVVVHPALASLAATGDGVILVAAGRPVTDEDVERTVLHEIEGHALPRTRAAGAALAIARVGTARGIDDQEGRALWLEDRAGMLRGGRRRQLASRHRAVEAMLAGATFADAAAMLVHDHGIDPLAAVVVAERVFRGGDGARPGLGRERVYLEAYVRVRRHLVEHPEDEAVLASGQIALHACDVLRAHVRA
jgi:hypothetical protein